MITVRLAWVLLIAQGIGQWAWSAPTSISERMHHLRVGSEPEWSNFPALSESDRLEIEFKSGGSDQPSTLRLRQQDVKQKWIVSLNETKLGELATDENDMVVYFDVPADTLLRGNNRLAVEPQGDKADDVRVGEIWLDDRLKNDILSEGTVTITVVDADSNQPTPCRITIINEAGALQSVGAVSNDHLAVRPGIVYTSTGQASIGLPAGTYRVIAARGFEYSIDQTDITVIAGDVPKQKLTIRREVPTHGYVACDTHVHSRTHSGHGDATVQERMITIAGEGIELPIATDHNAHVDHSPYADEMNVSHYFTPVIGNEVTTRTGHFNIFPVVAGSKPPDHRSDDWKETLDGIFATPDVKVAILNHARDLHGGTVPFGPKHFNDAIGDNTSGWPMGFNAMEIINSGATQTDPMQLLRDWMAVLNRGHEVTPVGSSDSHDVGRHFVGQGRTYIRCDDRKPNSIDVNDAVTHFLQGKVMVSYGLLTELTVNDQFQSGELAAVTGDDVTIGIQILGPHWVDANKILLFANGQLVREQAVDSNARDVSRKGIVWSGQWKMPVPLHDIHLVAVAIGKGIDSLHWRTAKPYQPDSTDPQTNVLGCSGAIWIDADRDGKKTSARRYAEKLVERADGDLKALLLALADYDEAVAAQSAALLESSGMSLLDESVQQSLNQAEEQTRRGFQRFIDAWRNGQIAKAGG